MKHFLVHLSILWLLSSTLCAGVEETRNKNPSYISLLVSNGELKELSINNNPLILSTLQNNKMIKQMKVLLFPGDIVSVKAAAKKGIKGGIIGSIRYIDENNNQIELYTSKDKWVCDKSIPGEQEAKNKKQVKYIWGPNYQEETVCEVQIPCKSKSGTSNDETKSNLRPDNSKQQTKSDIINTPEPSKPEPEPPKPEPSNSEKDESKKSKKKVIKKRRQSTITPFHSKVTTTISKPKVTYTRKPLESSIPSHIIENKIKKVEYNGHTYICSEKRKRAYRVDNGVTKCISSIKQYVCTYFKDLDSCVAYMKSNKPKYEIIDKDYTK